MTTTYDEPHSANLPTLPGCRIIVLQWSTVHGDCYDCGLPAAFHRESDNNNVCAICAANAAVDGEWITRLNQG